MPFIGEIKKAKELGYKYHQKYIRHACEKCGKERWVQLWASKPHFTICRSCALKGKPKSSYIRRETLDIIESGLKKCYKCGHIYPATIEYFSTQKQTKLGISSPCRRCVHKQALERRRKLGAIPIEEYAKAHYLSTIQRKVNRAMKTCIRRALVNGKDGHSWESLVGYTREKLMRHIEKQFQQDMSWDNYGKNCPNNDPPRWHIDHIIPISAFSFASYDDLDFKRCWALSNLRPLWGSENSKKGAKIQRRVQKF